MWMQPTLDIIKIVIVYNVILFSHFLQEALKTLNLDGMLSWHPPKIEGVTSECQGSR